MDLQEMVRRDLRHDLVDLGFGHRRAGVARGRRIVRLGCGIDLGRRGLQLRWQRGLANVYHYQAACMARDREPSGRCPRVQDQYMKHDKDAIDHSLGAGGSGIPTRHQDRSSNLRIRPELKPPRPWLAMIDAWGAMLGTLCSFLSEAHADQGRHIWALWVARTAASAPNLSRLTWTWMWSLRPCSMARKAAFTLGHAALLIERWRSASEAPALGTLAVPFDARSDIGQRAESELNFLAWQIDDARGERAGQALHGAPASSIPPHERVYSAGMALPPSHGGIHFPLATIGNVARAILVDRLAQWRGQKAYTQRCTEAMTQAFAETAIASLPDGPWLMTSEDVGRFLDMILEGARDIFGRTGDKCDTHRCRLPPHGLETPHDFDDREAWYEGKPR